jgi:predicted nuclease of restriction endonuclease-like (RecB) superfamily
MAEKKNQHLVPACYLRAFLSKNSEKNTKFEPGVFVNNSTLTDRWRMRSVNHRVFTKAYFYNLSNENPKNPKVENYLSSVESDFSKYAREVLRGSVTVENLSFMSYFVLLQFIRVESFIDMFQNAWDRVASFADAYDGGMAYQNAVKDLAKKQILSMNSGDIINSHACIVYNETKFPFLTSDSPVLRRQVNIDDMSELFPKDVLVREEDRSQEFLLVFFPISPKVAYVSCPLIKKSAEKHLSLSDSSLINIFHLNVELIKNSSAYVYSSVEEPIKGQDELSKYLVSLKDDSGIYAKIHTSNNRVISLATIESDEREAISLVLKKAEDVREINVGDDVSLVELISAGSFIHSMRFCQISAIDHETGFIRIESKIKLGL